MKSVLNISKFTAFIMLLTTILLNACSVGGNSTGIVKQSVDSVPAVVPARIVIPPVLGDVRISYYVNSVMVNEFSKMGFEVTPSEKLMDFLSKKDMQQITRLSSQNRSMLRDSLNIEGLVLAQAGVHLGFRPKAFMDVQFLDLRTGIIIWQARTGDTRWFKFSGEVDQSVEYVVKKALNLLKKDLKKQIKLERKEAAKLSKQQQD